MVYTIWIDEICPLCDRKYRTLVDMYGIPLSEDCGNHPKEKDETQLFQDERS